MVLDVDFDDQVPPGGPAPWTVLIPGNSTITEIANSCGRYGGRISCVSKDGKTMYCSDGINWRSGASNNHGGLPHSTLAHDWVGGSYVFDAEGGYYEAWFMVSPDNPSGRGQFAYSLDGISSWQLIDAPRQELWCDTAVGITNAGFRVVVIARNTKTIVMHDRYDNWHRAAVRDGVAIKHWTCVEFGAGSISKFVVLAKGSTVAQWSPDGYTWNQITVPLGNWTDMAYGKVDGVDYMCAVSGAQQEGEFNMMFSKNGTSWTGVTGFPRSEWTGVTFCKETETFIAVASDYAQNSSAKQLAISSGPLDAGNAAWEFGNMPSRLNWRSVEYAECLRQVIALAQNGEQQLAVWDLSSQSFSTTEDGVENILSWNEERIVTTENASFGTGSEYRCESRVEYLFDAAAELSSGIGKARFLQEDTPLTDSDFVRAGDLWYQPTSNTLHVRDSDEWVSLFQ